MKRTYVVIAAAMLFTGASLFAEEATVIDFTLLDADCVSDANGNATQNSHTVMDYSAAAGATFTDSQKKLMKTSLALPEWEIQLNSSAKNPQAVGLSTVVAAPVKSNADVPFAGKNVMGVRVLFPEWNSNANAKIVPPFEIPAYEKLRTVDENGDKKVDDKGNPVVADADKEWTVNKASGQAKTEFEDGFGVVKNVGTLKSIAVTTMGMNYPEGLYVMLKDTDGIERRYFMGYLAFDGWKTLTWSNPQYIPEVRTREIRIYPIYPRGLPFVKFTGFQVTRDANDVGGDYIGYFKDVKIIYDKALLTSDRDISDEDLWGIVGKKEADRQNNEMSRFGNKQVNRYLERSKEATEAEFTSTDYASDQKASASSTQSTNTAAQTTTDTTANAQ
ncbi:MAG: flagellar filament outer layer protein FlaA [Treponema sp.]|nr:flagellar filament outer layer protein FlaA [Treponema sp.]